MPVPTQSARSPSPKSNAASRNSQPTTKEGRGRSPRQRHRSRSRKPLGRVMASIRSRSPFRRNKDRTRSPKRQSNREEGSDSDDNMASEVDGEEFFDTRMDSSSYTVNSPAPKAGPIPKAATPNRPPPTPTSNSKGRPPLASVNVSEATSNHGNSPMVSQQGQSTFKFDKEHDKFSIGSSPMKKNTKRIPTPQNIMQNNPSPEVAPRRQTAPPGMTMASDAEAATKAFEKGMSLDPKTPFDRPRASVDVPNTAPNTAETFVKKKIRNTATPPIVDASVGATQQHFFSVDLGSSKNQAKGRNRRGNTLRKGFKKASNTAGKTNLAFGGLDEIKEAGTDDTAPTATESPSSGSAMSMDTSPIFSPMQQASSHVPAAAAAAAVGTASQGLDNPAQFHMGVGVGVGVANARTRSKRKDTTVRRAQFQRSQSQHVVPGPSRSSFDPNHLFKHRSDIMALKDEGRNHYLEKRFRESTRLYSQAIQKYKIDIFAHSPAKDLLAVLLWNRAAALLMIGAYESAADDARIGIHYVTDPRNTHQALDSPDANPVLRPKLYCRMGRSYLKLGKVDEADKAFLEAIQSATAIQDYYARKSVLGMYDELEKIKTEATLERTEASRLSRLLQEISTVSKQRKVTEVLGLINKALSTANGSKDLHLQKVQLLAQSNRWREVASHCERLAAFNTKFDGCLTEDLSKYNPFPGVPVAKHLKSNYFGGTKEDELEGAEMTLTRLAAAEAILRLPIEIMPHYLRALRLEERYHIAEKCISKLNEYITERAITVGNAIYEKFVWLTEERNKQLETTTNRDFADSLFTDAQYEQAANIYATCLHIDSGESSCAGGRLHAIIHCNRAACFMALKRHREAMDECTAALRIYPRYLKAILRRARCYSRLNQTRPAENDYRQWLKIIKQSKNGNSAFLGANIFHGPNTVKEKEVQEVEAELGDLLMAKAREAEAKAREERAQKMYKERSRQWNSERFDFSSDGDSSAHRRREDWYNSSSRRWDSFRDQQSKPKPKPKNNTKSQNKRYGRSPKDHKKFYSILNLDHRATEEEIRKAYKRKALKCHPDKNPDDPKAAENFRRVKEAYETLNDSKLRREYDAGR
eukprot:jgi/Psemu1/296963/fgenesh1_pm.219_\